MTVTNTMALTLLVTGSLSLYLILRAMLDLYHDGLRKKDDQLARKG